MRIFVLRWLVALILMPLALHAQIHDADTTSSIPEASSSGGGTSIGEGGLAGGWKWPLDDIKRFGDDGFTGWIRFNAHLSGFQAGSLLMLAGGTFFSSQDEPVFVSGGGTTFPARRTTSQYELSLNIGPQLGASTRTGFFRPRIAVAPGIYAFNTEESIRLLDDDEDFISETNTQIRFGWKGVAGVDLFFSQKLGVSLDFVYDAIWNLDYVESVDTTGATRNTGVGRYAGFLVGVIIPLEAMGN